MVYKFNSIFDWVDYLHEKIIWTPWFGCIHDSTNNWCTSGDSDDCTEKFTNNWNQYYLPKHT